jgi:hypothetical protein
VSNTLLAGRPATNWRVFRSTSDFWWSMPRAAAPAALAPAERDAGVPVDRRRRERQHRLQPIHEPVDALQEAFEPRCAVTSGIPR